MRKLFSVIALSLFFVPAASSAATVIYRDPASFLAALGTAVVQIEDYESTALETTIASGTALNGITYNFSDGRTGRVGDSFNNIGSRGLYATGMPIFFDPGQSFTISFAAPVSAVGGYYNIAESASEVLQLSAAGVVADGGGPSDVKDLTTFYFLGIISTSSFTTATFGVGPGAASGWNFDNLVYSIAPTVPVSVVPEPATWLMLLTGFAFTGAALRRRTPLLAIA